MSYNINWRAIIDEYEENLQEFIEKFRAEHPIDWSLFDTPIIDGEEIFEEEFVKQQDWNYVGFIRERGFEVCGIVKHIIANDTSAPVAALLGITKRDEWKWFDTWAEIVCDILANPNTTEDVLWEICLGMSYNFDRMTDKEIKVFKHIFEHPLITDEILDLIAVRACEHDEQDKIMEYAPNKVLEEFFEYISEKPNGVYSYDLDVLMQAPNISQKLFERAVEYVLSVEKERLTQDLAFDDMYETIDNLLTNPKTSMEYADKLRELRKQVSAWDEEEYSKL